MNDNNSTIRLETWNRRRVFVARDKNGKIQSWRYQKGSDLNLEEAKSRYKSNLTFRTDVRRVHIGRRADILISTTNTRQPKRFKQLGVVVEWYNRRNRLLGTTTGYSNMLSRTESLSDAKEQAFRMAKAKATTEGLVSYDHANFNVKEHFYQTYVTSYNESLKT